MPRLTVGLLLFAVSLPAFSTDPKCDAPDGWAASMTFAKLKNAGLADNSNIDFSKTKVLRLASQRIGKDLYRQVHRVIYFKHGGETIEAITVNDASNVECSMGDVEVFVVAQHFQAQP